MSNFDVNVDGRTDDRTDGRTNERTDRNLDSYIAPCYKQVRLQMEQQQKYNLGRISNVKLLGFLKRNK